MSIHALMERLVFLFSSAGTSDGLFNDDDDQPPAKDWTDTLPFDTHEDGGLPSGSHDLPADPQPFFDPAWDRPRPEDNGGWGTKPQPTAESGADHEQWKEQIPGIQAMVEHAFPDRSTITMRTQAASNTTLGLLQEQYRAYILRRPKTLTNTHHYRDWKHEGTIATARLNTTAEGRHFIDTMTQEVRYNDVKMALARNLIGLLEPCNQNSKPVIISRANTHIRELRTIRDVLDTTYGLASSSNESPIRAFLETHSRAAYMEHLPSGKKRTTPDGDTEFTLLIDRIFPGRLDIIKNKIFPDTPVGELYRQYRTFMLLRLAETRTTEKRSLVIQCNKINNQIKDAGADNPVKSIFENEDKLMLTKGNLAAHLRRGFVPHNLAYFRKQAYVYLGALNTTKKILDTLHDDPSADPDTRPIRDIIESIHASRTVGERI